MIDQAHTPAQLPIDEQTSIAQQDGISSSADCPKSGTVTGNSGIEDIIFLTRPRTELIRGF
jgi:hypothetical protein